MARRKKRTNAQTLPFGIAVLSVALATGLTELLQLWLFPRITPLFFLAIMVSAWHGGIRPGLLAAILSTFAINYFFVPPYYSLQIANLETIVQLCTFFAVAWIISSLNQSQLDSIQKAETALQTLKATIDREQEARALSETTKAQLEMVFSSIRDGFYVLDRNWCYTYASDRLCEMAGKSREELLGHNNWELFPEAVDTEVYVQFQRSLKEQIPVQFEYFYPPWNRWFEYRVYPSADGLTIFATEVTDRKQTEEALRRSEERLRVSQELSLDAFTILESVRNAAGEVIDFSWTYVNPKAAEILQHSVDELVGKRLLNVLTGNKLNSDLFKRYVQVVETGEPHDIELFYDADGITGWFRNMAVKLEDGVAIFFSDITARKQTELMLIEQKRGLELIATGQSLDECLSAICTSVSILSSHTRACVLLADAQRQTFPRSIAPAFPPSLGQGLKDAPINELAIGTCGTAVYCGESITCPDIANDDHWSQGWRDLCVAHGILACHSAPIFGLDGLPIGSLMLCFGEARMPTDWEYQLATFGSQVASLVFERDRAEVALRESLAILNTVNEVTPTLIYIKDRQRRLQMVNPATARLLGKSEAELIGKTEVDYLRPEEAEQITENDCRVMESGQVLMFEELVVVPEGNRIFLSAKAPYRDEQGNIIGLIGVSTDITDRKQAEAEREQLLAREQSAREAAERANRIKDEFLAVLSHELRSPLNPILGWSKLLQNGNLSEAKTQQALATIERNAKLQAELIEDLLDVSRILRGKLSLNVSPIDLASTIQAAIETVRLAAEAKSIVVETELEPAVGLVAGDATRLQQIVWNLLSNAVKFTPSGGQVTVQLGQVNNHAQLTVRDTGKGISPDFLPYVFDYFRQADSATTRKFGGLGLGLAIVQHLVELHGGTVGVASPGEGQGATFTVQLPLMSTPSQENQDDRAPQPSLDLSGIKILLVDDEPDTRDLVAFILEQQGAQVTVATSAHEALFILPQAKPDILLSDIGMPDMNGYMLIQQVRQLAPEQGGRIPAIALTAYAGDINQQQALAAGFQKHIAKPIEPEKLIHLISSLIKA